jgi:bifunctional ADP-heptose synthase (sugar kinase/adenylyltransferase)
VINIFANGVFDIITPAHYQFLSFCSKIKRDLSTDGAGLGVHLAIGLDSDQKVKQDKGSLRPFFSFEERANTIFSLVPEVSHVMSFDSPEDLCNIIKKLHPILIDSERWRDKVVGAEYAEKIIYFPEVKSYSTTDVYDRVIENLLYKKNLKIVSVDLDGEHPVAWRCSSR